MQLNLLFRLIFCIDVFFTVVKALPQDTSTNTDLNLLQVSNKDPDVVSQSASNSHTLSSVSLWTENPHGTGGPTISSNSQGFLSGEHLRTSFDSDQIASTGSPDEPIFHQAFKPGDCDPVNPANVGKIKREKPCHDEPDHDPPIKLPEKPIKKVYITECPYNKSAYCCAADEFDAASRSYGDCSECSCPHA